MPDFIQKTLIWQDIRLLDLIIELGQRYQVQGTDFYAALLRLKQKFEQDLIDNEHA